MVHGWRHPHGQGSDSAHDPSVATRRLVTDGGSEDDADPEDADGNEADGSDSEPDGDEAEDGDGPDLDRSSVEVTEAGGAEPADPKWEKPDPEDIPEFEIRADEPMARTQTAGGPDGDRTTADQDPTAGRPNTARSPGSSRISREGADGFVAALELCARLPDDVRLPEQAAELVPAAVEAELEQDIQAFAAAEFDNPSPHVDTLAFVERDGDIWVRLRLGIPAAAFDDLDPQEIRDHALQELEGLF